MPTDGPPSSGLSAITGAALSLLDFIKVVDASDTTYAGTGTDKRLLIDELIKGLDRLSTAPVLLEIFGPADALAGAAGDNKRHFVVPSTMDGKHLSRVVTYVDATSTSGNVINALRNITNGNVDMLSTNPEIAPGALHSAAGGSSVAAVVNSSNSIVHQHDMLSVDLEAGGTGTGVLGNYVLLYFAA
jgi:hypothetical protein